MLGVYLRALKQLSTDVQMVSKQRISIIHIYDLLVLN